MKKLFLALALTILSSPVFSQVKTPSFNEFLCFSDRECNVGWICVRNQCEVDDGRSGGQCPGDCNCPGGGAPGCQPIGQFSSLSQKQSLDILISRRFQKKVVPLTEQELKISALNSHRIH